VAFSYKSGWSRYAWNREQSAPNEGEKENEEKRKGGRVKRPPLWIEFLGLLDKS